VESAVVDAFFIKPGGNKNKNITLMLAFCIRDNHFPQQDALVRSFLL